MSARRDSVQAWRFGALGLLCIALIVLLGKSYETSLPTNDAAVHADLALSATRFGWLPRFPIGGPESGGHWAGGFNDHPFFSFYIEGWIMRLFGPTAWSAKLLPCLLSVGAVMLTAWLGLIWAGALTGALAGLILLGTRHFVGNGMENHLDAMMIFFILASFTAWEKRRPWLAAVLAGVGMWFKSPVALLLFPTQLVVCLLRQRWRESWPRLAATTALAIAVGMAVWLPVGLHGGWPLVRDYWVRQVWGTTVGGRGHARDFLETFQLLRSYAMPWTPLLVFSIIWAFWRKQLARDGYVIPLAAACIVVGAISMLRFKYGHYFEPVYPFVALLCAQPLARWLSRFESRILYALPVFALVAATVLVVAPVSLGPEPFPGLQKFAAIIQSYGDCADRILWVDGEHPYGQFYDFRAYLNFYTDRETVATACEALPAAAADPSVGWVLVAGGNLERCAGATVRARFPRAFRYGNQVLLTDRVPESKEIDLGVLAREHRAALDCKPAPWPDSRYQQLGR